MNVTIFLLLVLVLWQGNFKSLPQTLWVRRPRTAGEPDGPGLSSVAMPCVMCYFSRPVDSPELSCSLPLGLRLPCLAQHGERVEGLAPEAPSRSHMLYPAPGLRSWHFRAPRSLHGHSVGMCDESTCSSEQFSEYKPRTFRRDMQIHLVIDCVLGACGH